MLNAYDLNAIAHDANETMLDRADFIFYHIITRWIEEFWNCCKATAYRGEYSYSTPFIKWEYIGLEDANEFYVFQDTVIQFLEERHLKKYSFNVGNNKTFQVNVSWDWRMY